MQNMISSPLVSTVRRALADLGVGSSSRLLVGVSGGVDSMVILAILKILGYPVSAAHVNFTLRGRESDEDAILVKSFCEENNIPYYEKVIDTRQYSHEHKMNIQSSARELRYNWWEELMQSGAYDFMATAHHRDDAIETFFMNILRGTGIKGLTSIPEQRDFYIRPLLRTSKAEIETFAENFKIPFRIDMSNESDDYQRNRIRHHLIPFLKEFSNDQDSLMDQTLHRIRTEWKAWEHGFTVWQAENVNDKDGGYYLKSSDGELAFLLRWLEGKGLPWQLTYDYVRSGSPETGKTLDHDGFRLSRTKDGFYFEAITEFQPMKFEKPGTYKFNNIEISIEKVAADTFQNDHDPATEYVDENSLEWPLEVRQVKPGDQFQPLGMHGKSKKLQDYLVDLKLEQYEKERILILASADKIVWVVGKRLDERFKIHSGTKTAYRIRFSKMDSGNAGLKQ